MDIEITEAQPDRPANDSGANDPGAASQMSPADHAALIEAVRRLEHTG